MNISAISIVVPVYNEQDNLKLLCAELVEALTGQITFEVIFVDDASEDATRQCLAKLSAQQATVRYVQHQRNYGQSAAIISGVRSAQYDWIVTLDGNGHNDPADVLKLLSIATSIHANHRAVIMGHRKNSDDRWLKRIKSGITNSIRQFLLQDNCKDPSCSLKLFPKTIFLQLPQFDHMHRFLAALFKQAGYCVINIPVMHRPRKHEPSKYDLDNRLFVNIADLLGVYWLSRRLCHPQFLKAKADKQIKL